MPSHTTAQLSPKQDACAALLATGKSVRDCAAEVDAGVRTVYDWLEQDKFKKQVAIYQSRLIDEALGKLAEAATKAVQTLIGCLDSTEGENVKVRAALGILDQLVRLKDLTDIERRLSALEERMPHAQPSEPY
jgi:hypothetical protein